MTTASSFRELVKRIRTLLATNADVTKYVGTRIYATHVATIQDPVWPAISIHLTDGSKGVDGPFMDDFLFIMDFWFDAVGKDHHTWDDVFECFSAVKTTIHRNGGYNSAIKIYAIECIGEGPMNYEPDTHILHLQSRWRARVSV